MMSDAAARTQAEADPVGTTEGEEVPPASSEPTGDAPERPRPPSPALVRRLHVTIAIAVLLSAAAFAVVFPGRGLFQVIPLAGVVAGAVGAAGFFAGANRHTVHAPHDLPTRIGLGGACILLAAILATLLPPDWLLPVGFWAIATAAFIARLAITPANL